MRSKGCRTSTNRFKCDEDKVMQVLLRSKAPIIMDKNEDGLKIAIRGAEPGDLFGEVAKYLDEGQVLIVDQVNWNENDDVAFSSVAFSKYGIIEIYGRSDFHRKIAKEQEKMRKEK